MGNKVIIVNSDDWCGLYVNNQLIYQDNEIPSHIWWKVAQENPSLQYNDILDYYIDWDFLCEELGGMMPNDLNTIKNILEEE